MPRALHDYVKAERDRGENVDGPVVFHCSHRTHGVGMVDVADVVTADATVARAGTIPGSAVLVGTVSHCHGALGLLALGRAA